MANTDKKYRFPGVNSFTKADKDIFKGREEDTNNLFTLLMLSRTLVVHSESGTGKSSLIQAGLLQKLEDFASEYEAIVINLNDIVNDKSKTNILAEYTIKQILKIRPFLEDTSLKFYEKGKESLWTIAKKLELSEKKLLLIFDQFETLQSFSNLEINGFKSEVFDLLSNRIPIDIYKTIQENISESRKNLPGNEISEEINNHYKFLSSPGHAKVLFVIREDKLGTMSVLSDYFPDILKNDFVLPQLTKQNAFKAIVEPARAKGNNFKSGAFTFKNNKDLTDLIDVIADDQTLLVDPMQLQIVASTIEKNVVIKDQKNLVTKEHIPEINDIINNYYKNCWENVKTKMAEKGIHFTDQEFDRRKKKIIDRLIVNDRRNLVHSNLLISDYPVINSDSILIRELVNEGLIRSIPSGSDVYYQLCHDRFIKPVTDDVAFFDEKEKTRIKEKEAEDQKRILEEERKRQENEIRNQKKYIEEIKKAQQQSDVAQEEALLALIEKEDALSEKEDVLSKLRDTNEKLRRYRKFITIISIIVFLISFVLLRIGIKSAENAKALRALNIIDEALFSYKNERHDIAFRKLYNAYKDLESKRAEQLLDSLTFYEISGNAIVYNQNKNLAGAIYPDNSAILWMVKNQKLIKIAEIPDVGSMQISNSGKYIAYTNSDGTILRLLQVNNDLTIKTIRDSIINKKNNSKIAGETEYAKFDLSPNYFRFSPKENFVTYQGTYNQLDKFILLSDSPSEQLIYSMIQKLIKTLSDSINDIRFSYDENLVSIQAKNRNTIIYNLLHDKYEYKSKFIEKIQFNDSLPIYYISEFNDPVLDLKLVNYSKNVSTSLYHSKALDTFTNGYFLGKLLIITKRDVFTPSSYGIHNILKLDDSLPSPLLNSFNNNDNYEDFYGPSLKNGILLFKNSPNIATLVNTENSNSTNINIRSRYTPIFTCPDSSVIFLYNGLDSLYKLSKKTLAIIQIYKLKNFNQPMALNDNTIIGISNDRQVLLYDMVSKSIDTCQNNISQINTVIGNFVLGRTVSDYKSILFKPEKLSGEGKIKYFDFFYPQLPPDKF